MNDRIAKLVGRLKDNEGALISSKANIFYYSGFTSSDAFLYISHTKCAILTDSRYTVQAKMEAPGFEVVIDDIYKYLRDVPEDVFIFEEDYITAGQLDRMREKIGTVAFMPAQKMISAQRYIKDENEIKRIKAAEELGDAAFSHILNMIKPGISELEISLELEFFMRKNGAERLSFETICASGVRSAMPHGVASEKIINSGELVTLDFGCVLDGYCSDMTRTVIVGKADEKQKEIYDTVLNAQLAALNIIKAGLPCADADKAARDYIKNAGYGECFGHSLGHSVGIEIHESPNLSSKSTDVLQAGHVVTVEPGIYIENFGGVRIEDVVAITEDGFINLTKSDKKLTEL